MADGAQATPSQITDDGRQGRPLSFCRLIRQPQRRNQAPASRPWLFLILVRATHVSMRTLSAVEVYLGGADLGAQ